MSRQGVRVWKCIVLLATVALSKNASPVLPPTPTPSPDLVGLRGYRRFHANDSLVGRPLPCTRREKLCFQHNLIYNSNQEKCFAVGQLLPEWYISMVDTYEFLKGTGHIRGVGRNDFCSGYRMAYDFNCYQKELVRDVLCDCEAEPTPHILGGVECRCTPATRIQVEQPKEEGRCRIPDLRFPDDTRKFLRSPDGDKQGFSADYHRLSKPVPRFDCSSEQAQCFSEGKAWVSESRGCFPLLERGPCAEEHEVALDLQAAREGRAEATCVHVRGGCPESHVRMASDGQCHDFEVVNITSPGKVLRNQFGLYFGTTYDISDIRIELLRENIGTKLEEHGLCIVKVSFHPYITTHISPPSKPFCGVDNNNRCARQEVLSELPKPEL